MGGGGRPAETADRAGQVLVTYWREFLLLGLLLAGLEIAVNGVSLLIREIARALGSGGASTAPDRGGLPVAGGLLLALTGTAGLATSVWVRSVRRGINAGKKCPSCEGDTVRIRRRRRDRLAGKLLRQSLQRRACPKCGWKGLCAV